MTTLNEMFRKTSVRYSNLMKKYCQPLADHFGISCFSYNKITNSGGFSSIGNHPGWFEYYYAQEYYLHQPHLRHPRNFQSGISLPKHIKYDEYQEMNQDASNKFNINFGAVIVNKVDDGLILIGLDVNTPSMMHDVLLLNEIVLIRKFISKFVDDHKFLSNLLNDNQVDMAALLGDKFQKVDVSVMANVTRRKQFLKEIGADINIALSHRDIDVLKLLLEGHSASQMAAVLHLSCRTIEHYLERIKNKLSCYSKLELCKKARKLEQLGFFEDQPF